MTVRCIDHINLTVSDFAKTCDWYNKLFGFQLVEEGHRQGVHWGIIRAGDAMLCIYEHADFTQPSDPYAAKSHNINHFGLRITDKAMFEKKIEEENIKVEYGGPVHYPHSTSFYVIDPSGYEIEVACWKNDQITFAA